MVSGHRYNATENNMVYYTSRGDTPILLDESHVSKLLATCVSVGSLTAVTIQRIITRCQGDDVLAMYVQYIACYRMRMGIIGDQFAHSVADDLNIYYEQFPCVGKPTFQSRTKVGAFTRPRPS